VQLTKKKNLLFYCNNKQFLFFFFLDKKEAKTCLPAGRIKDKRMATPVYPARAT